MNLVFKKTLPPMRCVHVTTLMWLENKEGEFRESEGQCLLLTIQFLNSQLFVNNSLCFFSVSEVQV